MTYSKCLRRHVLVEDSSLKILNKASLTNAFIQSKKLFAGLVGLFAFLVSIVSQVDTEKENSRKIKKKNFLPQPQRLSDDLFNWNVFTTSPVDAAEQL